MNYLSLSARHNLQNLSFVLGAYREISKKSDKEVLEKQLGKLGREIFYQLREIRPGKGSIREEILARLKAGKGIRIRQSVADAMTEKWRSVLQRRQSRFENQFWGDSASGLHNWKYALQQKKVAREIAVRESGRGVLSISARYPVTVKDTAKAMSRYGSILSQVKIDDASTAVKYGSINWEGQDQRADSVVGGLQRPKGRGAINNAIQATIDDIMKYIAPRQARLITEAFRKGLGFA